MTQHFVDDKKINNAAAYTAQISQPPPTIWNANTMMNDLEISTMPSKHWSAKLETISEEKRKNRIGKQIQSRASLRFPNFINQPRLIRSETVALKAPASKSVKITSDNSSISLDNSTIRNGRERLIDEKNAAKSIQRAFRTYKLKKKLKSLQQNCKSSTVSSQSQQSSQEKCLRDICHCYRRDSNLLSSSSADKYSNQTSLMFKDYLKEGSLFFPERESVIVFGGIDPHSKYGDGRNTGRNIFRYNSELNQWDLVGELPQPRHHHAVAFLKGKVYLAGGTDPRDDDRGKTVVVGTVWSFDPISRAWYKETDMLTPRKNFGLSIMNGKLLAIGGQDKDGRILSSVERYDPITGVWEFIANLNTERTGAAATKYRDKVWVAGGMTNSRKIPLTSTVESYDAKHNVWNESSPLRFPRCFGCLFAMNDTLYFIGGAGRASDKERSTSSCNAIDIWNPKEEEWKLHFAMSIPRHGHAVAYLGTQILIIGGVTTAYLRALTDVECFCCERKTWVRGLMNLPVPLSGHGAVTLPPASLM